MSLINDALRRAGEVDRRRRQSRPSRLSPLQPVDRLDRSSSGLKWVGALLVISFATALWFLWQATQPVPSAAEVPRLGPPRLQAPALVPFENPAERAAPVPLESVNLEEGIKVSTNLVRRVIPQPPSDPGLSGGASLPPGAGVFPEIRLQSIIVTSGRPMAMINGQTVVAGERIEELQVVEIGPTSVLVRWQGGEREVRLREF